MKRFLLALLFMAMGTNALAQNSDGLLAAPTCEALESPENSLTFAPSAQMCSDLNRLYKESRDIAVALTPVLVALKYPGVRSEMAASVTETLAALGISASTAGSLVITAGVLAAPLIVVLKVTWDECQEMNQQALIERIKEELIRQSLVNPNARITVEPARQLYGNT
jgi:hypothetical protein